MNIVEALADPNLFGALPCFADLSTWKPWLTLLKATYGLPLDASEIAIFRAHTGRTLYEPPPGGWREVACIVGRQSGKTQIAAILALYEALVAPPDPSGSERYCLLVAQDQRAGQRALLGYVKAILDASQVLGTSVVATTADSVSLDNAVRIAAYPCRPAAVRGLRARIVVCDELAFYRSSDNYPTDAEMFRAVRPTLSTTGGRLIAISSPYGQSGVLWDLHRRHYGRDDSPVLVWQATAPEMNPTLDAGYLERMREEDPEGYRAEVLGEFRAGQATLFDPELLDDAVVTGRRELPPARGARYVAFVDPSGGRQDAFALAIGHREGEALVIDALRVWEVPFNPTGAIDEAAAFLRTYGLQSVVGDHYGGDFPREAFRRHGITYQRADKPKSDLYLSMLAAVNSRRVELLDDPALLRELRGLERRRGPSGRDRVDHRPGSHDDRANAVAGVVDRLVRLPDKMPKPRVILLGPVGRRRQSMWV